MTHYSTRGSSLLVAVSAIGLLSGCGDSPTAPEHYSRAPDASFAVRSGTTINPIGSIATGIFDNGRDEAFLEFPIDFPTSAPVVATFTVFDFSYGPNDPPATDFKVAVYDANGQANASDYGRGILRDTLSVPRGDSTVYSIDLTDVVAELQGLGVSHVGLRLYDTSLGQLGLQPGAMLEAGP